MSAEPLLYSCLTDALDQQLPATLIRLILSLSDVLRLPLPDVDELLPILSGRYKSLSSSSGFVTSLDRLEVGQRLDVKNQYGYWCTGVIAEIAPTHADHIDEDDDYDFYDERECQSRCPECTQALVEDGKYDKYKDREREREQKTEKPCIWIEYDGQFDDGDEGDQCEWISTYSHCYVCQKAIPSRLQPFLSNWNKRDERNHFGWHDYIRPGIWYPRPYLDKYIVDIYHVDDASAPQFADRGYDGKIVLNIRRVGDNVAVVQQRLVLDGSVFMAMTCDDRGRIYALSGSCRRLAVITVSVSGRNIQTVWYALQEALGCGYGEREKDYAYVMRIDDARMVLYIQELEDVPKHRATPVHTYAFALPFLPAAIPTFTE